MNCFSCRRPYDETSHTPRLLIGCGHSLCESCLVRGFSGGKVSCPQCQVPSYSSSIQQYPKNLALIAVSQQVDVCQRHGKKFQAFCQKDRLLLCVSCIIEDGHRNHPIDSISSASDKEREKLSKMTMTVDRLYQQTQERLTRLEQILRQATIIHDETQNLTDKFFLQIKKLIAIEEESVKSKAKQSFLMYQNKCRERQVKLMQQLQVVDQLMGLVNQSESYSHVELLDSVNERQELLNQLTAELQDIQPFSTNTATKNQLCDIMCKQIEKMKGKDVKEHVRPVSKKSQLAVPDRYRKMNNLKENNSQKPIVSIPIMNKKPSKKEPKDCRKTPPIIQKPLPKCQVSAFDHDPSLFKSFLSSNASFFMDRRSIYVFGGFCQQSNSVIRYNLDSKKWEHVCTMMNRSKFGIATVNNEVYLLGGKRDKQRVSIGEKFSQGQIAHSFGLEAVRSGFGCVVMSNEIIVIGGNDGDHILRTTEKYSQKEGCWQRLDNLIESRDELAATIGRDGKIYAVGGFGSADNVCLKSVERYDPVSMRWESVRPMLNPRRALSAVTLADGIYAIGGFDGQNYLNSVEKYDQFANSWTEISPMNHPRCTHFAVAVFQTQEIYVFGGFDYSPLASIERYSVVTDAWQDLGQMPMARFMHGCTYLRQ